MAFTKCLFAGLMVLELAVAVAAAPLSVSEPNHIQRRSHSWGLQAWSPYTFVTGGARSNYQYFIESRGTAECALTMESLKDLAYSDDINMLPDNKPQVIGCAAAPNREELKSKLFLSLPTPECSCVPSVDNTVAESLGKICALVLGEPEDDWTDVFKCSGDNADIQIWRFDDLDTAERASHCMNVILKPGSQFGGHRVSFYSEHFEESRDEIRYIGWGLNARGNNVIVQNLDSDDIGAVSVPASNAADNYQFDILDAGYFNGEPAVVIRTLSDPAECMAVNENNLNRLIITSCNDDSALFAILPVEDEPDKFTIRAIGTEDYIREVKLTGNTNNVYRTVLRALSSDPTHSRSKWSIQIIDGPNAVTLPKPDYISLKVPDASFETFSFNQLCYIRSTDDDKCADALSMMNPLMGDHRLQCRAIGKNTVVAPIGSCYNQPGTSQPGITETLEQVCFEALNISRPNIKYDRLGELEDDATCEVSQAWSFQRLESCDLFASCLAHFYLESTKPVAPTMPPTRKPTMPPTPKPTPPPTLPTLRPTPIKDVKRYCKSIECESACTGFCGWHTKKQRCVPFKVSKRITQVTSAVPCP